MSASTSRTLPPEIAESVSVMALIERGKAEGQIAGDDVRRAFEADQIPATQWKNVLRSLNQILEEEGVTLMVSAAEPKRPEERRSEESGQAHRHQDGRGEDGDHQEGHRRPGRARRRRPG